MPAPFYNLIKGTTSGIPGTSAFTPSGAASGFRAWSTVPTGWIGLVRFEDGSAWELSYCYWNGTTLSRGANQLYDSSTGSVLSLTSAATAALVADAAEVMSHLGGTPWRGWFGIPAAASLTSIGIAAPTNSGTIGAAAIAVTNYFSEQPGVQYTSATTASAWAGWSTVTGYAAVNTTAGRGGFECVTRCGASQLPTGPRLFVGMTSITASGSAEPSALVGSIAAFAKDSTDTDIQLLTNSGAGAGTKIDTGIALAANGWYEMSTWIESGSNKVWGLLVRFDTGDIFLKSTTTNVPANGALLSPQAFCGLNATNTGTAAIFKLGATVLRTAQ